VRNLTPKSLQETLELLNEGNYKILAGGTDLMIQNRSWSNMLPDFKKDTLLVFNLEELKYMFVEEECLHIGSGITLEELKHHELTPAILVEAAEIMASPAIRHMATIGGNIGNASPAGDSLPGLYVSNATVVLKSIERTRDVPIEEFILGPGKTALQSNEIIVEVKIPLNNFNRVSFDKVGGRKADAISKVSFAGLAKIKNNMVQEFRVAFGAVGPTVVRRKELEAKLIGVQLDELESNIEEILEDFAEYIRPINDQRSNKEYRKTVAINLLKSFILGL